MSRYFDGIDASPGIAIAKVLVKDEDHLSFERKEISDIEAEQKRLLEAVAESKEQLSLIKDKVAQDMGQKEAEIFAAHLMLLDDPEVIPVIEKKIAEAKINAEAAVADSVKEFVAMFESLDDQYLKERASDIQDVGNRVLKNLLGKESNLLESDLENVILVAKDLTPSDTAQINKGQVLGFVTSQGGNTSHSAIMARSLEIPAVVGVNNILTEVETGTEIIIDGTTGKIIVEPSQAELEKYRTKQQEFAQRKKKLAQIKDLPAETEDGHQVEMAANIGTPNDISGALENGAEAIGLYRSEFLYMDRDSLPTEDEQFKSYKEVAQKIAGPVIIRTLDIGGDKELPYLDLPKEMNPFLGYRAIRICLDQPELFKIQLRAILRASNFGDVKIMYPMISSLEELRAANQVLKEVKAELKAEGIAFDSDLEVGMMIEVPAAAMIADILAKEVDFFSIGTNDLIQYTTAVDRMNQQISDLYRPFHPAILRLIKRVVDAAHQAGKWAGMCGEMAGNKTLTPFLLGIGLDEFSMSAISIPEVKSSIRNLTLNEAEKIAAEALKLGTAKEVEEFLSRH